MDWISRRLVIGWALGVAACGATGTASTGAPNIVEFQASESLVMPGTAVSLTWRVERASTISILSSDGGAALLIQKNLVAGTAKTPPITKPTTFTLTAMGKGGMTSAAVRVTVPTSTVPVELLSIDRFTVAPATIKPGLPALLSWRLRGATGGKITVVETGAILPLGETFSGTIAVMPRKTTHYLLSAQGLGGPKTARVVLTVDETLSPHIYSFRVTPDTLQEGHVGSLVWAVDNTTQVLIEDGRGTTVYRGRALTSQVMITPPESTRYLLTASSPSGTATAATSVTVNPIPGSFIVAFSASPSSVAIGEATTLSWKVERASVEIRTGTRVLMTSTRLTGTFTTTPTATSDYTLLARNSLGDAMATALVTANRTNPVIARFTAEPNPAVLYGRTILSWETASAVHPRLYRNSVLLEDTSPPATAGSRTVVLTSTADHFRLEADQMGSTAASELIVLAAPRAEIAHFDVTPHVYGGASQPVMLSWITTGAYTVELDLNGSPVLGFPGTPAGSFQLLIARGSDFDLVAPAIGNVARVRRHVLLGTAEMEPNDVPGLATIWQATTGIRGTLDPSTDHDVAAIAVLEGGSAFAELSDLSGGACSLDAVIDLLAPDGVTRLARSDPVTPQDPCARLDGTRTAAARNLSAGRYYLDLHLASAASRTGAYGLTIEARPPACGNGILEAGEECDEGVLGGIDGACLETCRRILFADFRSPGGSELVGLTSAGSDQIAALEIARQGQPLSVTIADAGSGGCTTPLLLALGTSADPSAAPLGSHASAPGQCAAIDSTRDAFARDLAPGTYYLSIANRGPRAALLRADVRLP